MSIEAFSGGAGCGKTYSVMEQVARQLATKPLEPHQKVLALTFMHGSRHRLDEQLEKLPALRGRHEASTVDSFAWLVCRRMRARVREMGGVMPASNDFHATCALAAELLADPMICKWVAASYPIIIVDEAQDLDASRLKIVEGLLSSSCLFLAYDEFQCLDASNRPAAVLEWIEGKCVPKTLDVSKRTDVTELLLAASQVRGGQPLTADGPSFKVRDAPGPAATPHLAAALVAYQISKGGTFALITPTRREKAPFVQGIIDLVGAKPQKSGIGPYRVLWERSEDPRADKVRALLGKNVSFSYADLAALLSPFVDFVPATSMLAATKRARDAGGVESFSSFVLKESFERSLSTIRQNTRRHTGGRRAMTVHQAKNREFDHVVLVWPFQTASDPDDRRRIFYNAITRARRSCLVILQKGDLRNQAPFV